MTDDQAPERPGIPIPGIPIWIRVLTSPLDPCAEQTALTRGRTRVGALVTFIGLTRDFHAEDTGGDATPATARLFLEHYPGMTEQALAAIAESAARRWPIDAIRLVHRVGSLAPGDPIVFVGVTSRHRAAAFRACEFLIDVLKTRAPFWKKECGPGGDRWVAARAGDERARERWDVPE